MEDNDFVPAEDDEFEIIYSDGEGDDEFEGDESMEPDISQADVVDISRLTFTKHSKAVFSSDLSKDQQLAVTGGEDDSAFVWSTTDGKVVLECTGHKDSVTEVSFNHDNQFLATGDMAGMIQVWSVKDKKLIWCYEGDDMEWLTWHPIANVLISGSQSGDIYMWQIPQGNCKIMPSHGSSCSCGKVLSDGKHLLAGYSDGKLKLWDLKTANPEWQHSEDVGITSIEINSDGSLIAIAPTAVLLKTIDGKPISSLLIDDQKDIESLVFNSELNVLITGSLSGDICVWDTSKQIIRHQAKVECGVTVIKLSQNGKVLIGGTDGAVYLCDVRNGTLLETLTGHLGHILSISVPLDGSFVLSTAEDGTAKIFNTK